MIDRRLIQDLRGEQRNDSHHRPDPKRDHAISHAHLVVVESILLIPKTAFTDGQGHRTEFEYDGADRQIRVSAGVGAPAQGDGTPVQAAITVTYDGAGNITTVKDGRNHGGSFDVRYTYDARYRRTSATNAELETTLYEYDANDNVSARRDPGGDAFVTRYRYDEVNRLLAVDETARASATTAAGVTRFFYDGARNLIALQDANGSLVTHRYDGLNRVTDVLQHTEAGCLTAQTTRSCSSSTASVLVPPTSIPMSLPFTPGRTRT